MGWALWPALAPGDALVVPAPPPAGYLEYLTGQGLAPPLFLPLSLSEGIPESVTEGLPATGKGVQRAAAPAPDLSAMRFTPFGWNAEAVTRNAAMRHPSPHPDPEVVRRVNSRAFGLDLEQALFPGDACPAVFCSTRRELARWLHDAPSGRYVAKGNHGHAGIGQIRFALSQTGAHPSPQEAEARSTLEKKLRRLLERHQGVVVEEEQRIEQEWGVLFRVGHAPGVAEEMRVHRLVSGASGGFAGALVLPRGEVDPAWEAHRPRIEEGVGKIARALRDVGYFGPVGIDVYTHRAPDGSLRLRPLVDLNARVTMAWPLHGLARRFPDRAILLRHEATTALHIPLNYAELLPFLDKMSRATSNGGVVIWLTPLLPLSRHALAFLGASESEVIRMHGALRDGIHHINIRDA